MIFVRTFAHPRNALRLRSWLVVLLLISFSLIGARAALADEQVINLRFAFGEEKKDWLEDVTKTFNEDHEEEIHVELEPMASVDIPDAFKIRRRKPQLVSPTSDLSLQKINSDLLDPPEYRHLLQSPVVIAMWEEKAKALGWPDVKLGWNDIRQLSERKEGWAADVNPPALGQSPSLIRDSHPKWGRFKFAYTDPFKTDSGMAAILAQGYVASHKISGLTAVDVNSDETHQFLSGTGRSISLFGPSSVRLGAQMSAKPALFDAAVLFESHVVVHNLKCEDECSARFQGPRLVAIYPKEGTVVATHPISIVKDVTPEERKAAEAYIEFLLEPCQQKKALKYGFRPGVATAPIGPPVDAAHGVDPEQPRIILEIPRDPAIIQAAQNSWDDAKKPANIILAIDISGSMGGQKITEAVAAAKDLVDQLDNRDCISIVSFNYQTHWIPDMRLGVPGNREKVKAFLDGLKAEYQTLLHKTVEEALTHLEHQPADLQEDSACIIVLSDGKDNDIQDPVPPISVEHVEQAIQRHSLKQSVAIYTIGYGLRIDGKIDQSDLDVRVLERIAGATVGHYHLSSPEEIRSVLKEMADAFSRKSATSSH